MEIPERLKSRKFIVTLTTLIAMLIGVSETQTTQFVSVVIAYLLAQGWVDAKNE